VLDVLVAEVTSIAAAALWIAERFEVPSLRRRKHLKNAGPQPYLVGHERGVGRLIRSGLWSDLSAPAQAIAPILWEFSEWDSHTATATVTLSYRAMARYAGIVSPNAVSRALAELEDVGWLRRIPEGRAGGVRAVSSYEITPESDSLGERAGTRYDQIRREIETERELRNKERVERKNRLKAEKSEARCY
jgi:DNA-binding PadR family transcriptional regulator